MLILRHKTSTTLQIGPFLDNTDGYTPETALTVLYTDVKLSKAGLAYASKHNVSSATHDTGGWYRVPVDVTDTDTLGTLQVSIQIAGALPVYVDAIVVTQAMFDAFCGNGLLRARPVVTR